MAPNYSTTNSDQIIKSDNVNNALEVKEMVNGLDPDNNPHDRKIYEEARRKLIGHFEDQANPNGTPYVYFDSVGKRTVGIGFNMDDGSARIEWQKAFSALPENERPDFDAVLVKKIPLTQKQIDVLFNYSVKEREESLIKQFGKAVWEWLTPSERLSIESLRYNGKFVWSKTNSEDSTEERRKRHCFTGEHTKFTKNLRAYSPIKRIKYWIVYRIK